MTEKIAILGLGYVGLPLLINLGRHFPGVIGFDIDPDRTEKLRQGLDWNHEISAAEIAASHITLTNKARDLADSSFFIVTVPTPIDETKRPDLAPLLAACQTLGAVLRDRSQRAELPPLIVFESTVYPGLTEEICGTALSEASGLTLGHDFYLGYSPERINPGDTQNRLETITKIISASDPRSLSRMEAVYSTVTKAGLHKAPSIRVAEAAKVLENTQRDLNVALMNELALICDRLNIRTQDVLAAARTKWNFLNFVPGLVGGHCIGVDPYYLTTRAEQLGYHPQVILAGRRINDGMPAFIAQKVVKLMISGGDLRYGSRIGIVGLTFKENVRDIRNSRVPDIVRELENFGIHVLVHDPLVEAAHAERDYAIKLKSRDELNDLDALILAVPHKVVMDNIASWWPSLRPQGWVIDIKSALQADHLPSHLRYWSL